LKLLHQGKVKDVYAAEDGNLLFHFTDRISAFDVRFPTPVPRKGEVLCRFAEYWFTTLYAPNHMIRVVDRDKMLVRPLKMIGLECVVRGYFYGSLAERFNSGLPTPLSAKTRPELASRLDHPIFDPTTKSEEHDRPVTTQEAIEIASITHKQYDYLSETSVRLYQEMSDRASAAGYIMSDVKFEFGFDAAGDIVLADSLGPDEFRLWKASDYSPGKIQDSYDKQILRDWLVETGFKRQVDMLAAEGKKPTAPAIPQNILQKLSERYIAAYESVTGRDL
jgi:phosphoribosylaminoimidazole-succinocarboxamide synthase